MNNIEVESKITLKIKGVTIELSREDASNLYYKLKGNLGISEVSIPTPWITYPEPVEPWKRTSPYNPWEVTYTTCNTDGEVTKGKYIDDGMIYTF